jgi:thiol:disulfide interchange protein DsbG
MRRALLVTSLLLLPSLASAQSQCSVEPSDQSNDVQSVQQLSAASQQSSLQPPTAIPATRIISAGEVSRVPALRRIASTGALLTDLGTEHGLRTIFARNGQSFQVFYLTPDGQGAVGGVMWDAAGRNITRQQVSSIDGAIPTVTIGAAPTAPSRTPQTTSTSALQAAASATYGITGVASAPRLWVFIDPLCSFSVHAMEQLRPFIASGKVQVAVVPLSLLDYEDHGRSTIAARVMLSKGSERMVAVHHGRAPRRARVAIGGCGIVEGVPDRWRGWCRVVGHRPEIAATAASGKGQKQCRDNWRKDVPHDASPRVRPVTFLAAS